MRWNLKWEWPFPYKTKALGIVYKSPPRTPGEITWKNPWKTSTATVLNKAGHT